MFSLKVAAIAASAAGAVTVGGVTWAAVSQPGADLRSGQSKASSAVQQAKDSVRAPATPTCVPNARVAKPATPELPANAKAPKTPKAPKASTPSVPNAPQAKAPTLPKAPQTPAAPDAQSVPKAGAPAAPSLPKGEVQKPAAPSAPSTCAPSNADVPTTAPSGAPAAPKAPSVPNPGVPTFTCANLTPAVQVGGAVERAVLLPKGLKYSASQTGSKTLAAKKICTVTQKWTGRAGQWVTVERIKTGTKMTEDKLRQSLRLPDGGRKVSVGGAAAWQSPTGDGVLVVEPDGYSALLVNGSPVFAGSLQDMAGKLRQAQ